MWSTWAIPTHANSSDNNVLTKEQITSWREKGFALVDGIISDELTDKVLNEAIEKLTPIFEADGQFGSNGLLEFPTGMVACDEVSLHPRILMAAAQLLNVPIMDLRMTQSDVWMKKGKEVIVKDINNNNNQRVHCDYGNHSLVHPPSWDSPEVVAMIVYYSDAEEVGGSTALVAREGSDDPAYQWPLINMPGIGGIHYINDRNLCEDWMKENRPEMYEFRQKLYQREVPVKFRKGTVLLYRHDVFHRGTPVKPNKTRYVQNLVYRKSSAEWINTWNQGYARSMYGDSKTFKMEEIIGKSTPEQRCVLGFPAPNHSYWNNVTLNAVRARFEVFGFDKTPYEKAIKERECEKNN